MNVSEFVLLLIIVLYLITVVIVFRPSQRSRTKAPTPADRQYTDADYRDDDRYWRGGFLYNNPDDPAVFVRKRFGLGWTLNFGHPQSKLILGAILLFPLVLLILNILLFGTAPIGCHPSGCYPPP